MRKMHVAIVAIFITLFTSGLITDVSAAAIGNTVWNDHNKNGIQDPGEEGIAGVEIKLYNGDKVYRDTTNSRGRYKFKGFGEGHYDVIVAQETLPEGCYATHDRDGNNDGIYKDRYLEEDDYFTKADFGYYCPSHAPVGHVSPVTGSGTAAVIIAFAVAIGFGFIAHKWRNTTSVFSKK
ncbi:MAG: hypothetical protein CR972_01225 [Candidatus Moraniibacteriota bacterium]|nr:MAG: hypothetical protein CR972_01225 [Candidatus Moranbacteria bacterium]